MKPRRRSEEEYVYTVESDGYLTEEDINELTRMVATLLYRHLREKQELMTLKKEGDQK
jgi:hypothetical protein